MPTEATPATVPVRTAATPSEARPLAPGNGKLSGVLTDSTTNNPVEFATIALVSTTYQ